MGFLHRGHFFTIAGRHVPGYICHTHKTEGRKNATSFLPKEHPCRVAIRHWHAHNTTRQMWQEYQRVLNGGKPLRGMTLESHKRAWERAKLAEEELEKELVVSRG